MSNMLESETDKRTNAKQILNKFGIKEVGPNLDPSTNIALFDSKNFPADHIRCWLKSELHDGLGSFQHALRGHSQNVVAGVLQSVVTAITEGSLNTLVETRKNITKPTGELTLTQNLVLLAPEATVNNIELTGESYIARALIQLADDNHWMTKSRKQAYKRNLKNATTLLDNTLRRIVIFEDDYDIYEVLAGIALSGTVEMTDLDKIWKETVENLRIEKKWLINRGLESPNTNGPNEWSSATHFAKNVSNELTQQARGTNIRIPIWNKSEFEVRETLDGIRIKHLTGINDYFKSITAGRVPKTIPDEVFNRYKSGSNRKHYIDLSYRPIIVLKSLAQHANHLLGNSQISDAEYQIILETFSDSTCFLTIPVTAYNNDHIYFFKPPIENISGLLNNIGRLIPRPDHQPIPVDIFNNEWAKFLYTEIEELILSGKSPLELIRFRGIESMVFTEPGGEDEPGVPQLSEEEIKKLGWPSIYPEIMIDPKDASVWPLFFEKLVECYNLQKSSGKIDIGGIIEEITKDGNLEPKTISVIREILFYANKFL